jgi:hypothetical protein
MQISVDTYNFYMALFTAASLFELHNSLLIGDITCMHYALNNRCNVAVRRFITTTVGSEFPESVQEF